MRRQRVRLCATPIIGLAVGLWGALCACGGGPAHHGGDGAVADGPRDTGPGSEGGHGDGPAGPTDGPPAPTDGPPAPTDGPARGAARRSGHLL